MTSESSAAPVPGAPRRELSLLDSTCLIVGIIVGVGIFQVAPEVARGTQGAVGVLLVWLAGGVISLCGAFSYAELASAYPRQGGDYAYMTEAYGRWAGFLFGWVQLVIARPGDIAVVAFTFATYAHAIGWTFAFGDQVAAAVAVAILTAINVAGVKSGKWTQNILTFVKVAGLLIIVVVAGILTTGGAAAPADLAAPPPLPLSLALILVLFSFGGWNEMVYVAAEVRKPERNIWRALILGTVAVTVLYLIVNAAFLHALGYTGVAGSEAVAVDAVGGVLPQMGGVFVGLLIAISALGALNGLIFAGGRISFAVGRDHPVFSWLGQWDARGSAPKQALVAQGLIAIVLIFVLGSFLNTILYTAAPVYLFYVVTNLAVVVLRRKDPEVARPFRVPWYPLPLLVFGAACLFLLYSAIVYRPVSAIAALVIIAAGLPVYWIQQSWTARKRAGQPP